MKELAPKQKEVLDYITKFSCETCGRHPSYRQIARAINVQSTSTVDVHLKALKRKGYLKDTPTPLFDRETTVATE